MRGIKIPSKSQARNRPISNNGGGVTARTTYQQQLQKLMHSVAQWEHLCAQKRWRFTWHAECCSILHLWKMTKKHLRLMHWFVEVFFFFNNRTLPPPQGYSHMKSKNLTGIRSKEITVQRKEPRVLQSFLPPKNAHGTGSTNINNEDLKYSTLPPPPAVIQWQCLTAFMNYQLF